MKNSLRFFCVFIIGFNAVLAQIPINSLQTPVTENFDGMGSSGTTYPTGWTAIRYAGTGGPVGATLTMAATDGNTTTGNAYNVGSSGSNERALGTLASGGTVPAFGAQYSNSTGGTVNDLSFSGIMEQWRSGSSSSANEVVVFEYSLDATSLSTGTWTAATGMDFHEILTSTTTSAAVNGNDPGNRTSISTTLSGLGWANGTTLWIRWRDNNDANNDGLYAIDDFSVTAGPPTGDGTGSASVDPDTTTHGTSFTMTITYHRNISFTVTDLRVILPSNFAWSHATGDVGYTNMTATKSINGDTIYLNAISWNADSTVIMVQNVTAADSTAYYYVNVQSKALTDYKSTSPSPRIVNFGIPVSIGDVKGNDANGIALRVGQLVTISGIVSVANQFGGPSYLQDNTGGIAVFGSSFSTAVSIGDEVIVSGKVDPFNGVTEITSPYLHQILSTGNTLTPIVATCSQLKNDGANGIETYEGLLVQVNAVVVRDTFGSAISSWAVAGSGTNYRLIDASGYVDVRVDNNVDFANTPAPQGTFDIIGVDGQFKTTSPYIGGYQVLPRMVTDILTSGPIIATVPVESNVTSSSFRISWTTVHPGTSRLRYGKTTAYELGVIEPDNTLRTSHAIDLTGLDAATIYHVKAFSIDASDDTSEAADLAVITTSPPGVTGQINVYFNKSVNTSVSLGEDALGNQDLIAKVSTRIDNAKRSIDLALYSLSATNQGDVLASHLVVAKNRGVKIRVICEHDNRNAAGNSFQTLANNGIPVIDDAFDAVWAGAGLSHNKFFIFDARGGAAESMWVWTGSWNPTFQGTTSDRQNSIEIQDAALASAYTTEFEEMWGSNTDTPNAANSRFGARKTDNVPHNFVINGTPVSLYFSPSDHTTAQIRTTLGRAQSSISSSILTFTRKDIADTVISKKNAGKKTRIVIDNNTDTGNQYAYLQSNGVDVHLKGGSGLLHHKYAIVDADQTGATQYVLTGSHNWSNSAENSNDENILIVQSNRVANLYLQEFAARYYEAGGTDSIHLSSSAVYSASPTSLDFDTLVVNQSKQDSFTVSNIGNLSMSISSISSTNPRFSVTPSSGTVSPSSSSKFYVTFTPTLVGLQSGYIILAHDAPGSPDSINVQGVGKEEVTTVKVNIPILDAWNMVSLPVIPNSTRRDSLFPTSISRIFTYGRVYYNPLPDTFVYGAGYWLKFDTAQAVSIMGLPIQRDTINVQQFWNMIGSISNPVPIASIIQDPPSIVTASYYGFSGSYDTVDTLIPGKAYWVKTNQAGKLILSSSAIVPKRPKDQNLDRMSKLSISDANGRKQTLYFGAKPSGEFSLERYELPPLPPKGSFDVRFRTGRTLEVYAKDAKQQYDFPIDIQTEHYPVTVEWTLSNEEMKGYILQTIKEGERVNYKLTREGQVTLYNINTSLTLIVSSGNLIPTQFSLEQNYPNPFNPRTTISFGLPQKSNVSLTVYNLLGQTVKHVLENEVHEAGYHNVHLDLSEIPSGMYIYRIHATTETDEQTEFQEYKKLVLLK